MAKDTTKPRYLQDKDGNVNLYAGADIEAARINGMVDPVGRKSNGEPWNPEVEEGEVSPAEAAGEVAKVDAERKARIAQRKDKEAEASRKAGEKAAAEATVEPPKPDFRVEVIDPKKGKK